MFYQIDDNPNFRKAHPTSPTFYELIANWRISPERHQAYATLWKYLTFVGVFANTAMWLYF